MEIFDQDIQLASYGGDEEPEKYTYEHFRPIDVHLKVPSTRRCTDIGGPRQLLHSRGSELPSCGRSLDSR